jgi:hypothetical protein
LVAWLVAWLGAIKLSGSWYEDCLGGCLVGWWVGWWVVLWIGIFGGWWIGWLVGLRGHVGWLIGLLVVGWQVDGLGVWLVGTGL